jgi:hypothetical protein
LTVSADIHHTLLAREPIAKPPKRNGEVFPVTQDQPVTIAFTFKAFAFAYPALCCTSLNFAISAPVYQ